MSKMLTLFLVLLMSQLAMAKNMRVMDEGDDGEKKGFSLVRTGKPQNLAAFKKLCEQGVRRMIVMAGNGKALEEEYAKSEWGQKNCAGFQVVYDCKQSTHTPLTKEFLDMFDKEVASAKAGGYALAFRCNCGCHRTGRLAAYYRMKYQGWTAEDAVADQRKSAPGIATFYARRELQKQIFNLKDYIEAQKQDPSDMGCKPVVGSGKRNLVSKKFDKKYKDRGYEAADCVTNTADQSCNANTVSTDPDDTEDLEKKPAEDPAEVRVPASEEKKSTNKQ